MRKDVDDATMVRVDLERKIEGLREELEYSRKVRNEEIEDLKQQIEEQGINVEVDGITPDMNQILAQIRQEYDEIAVKNRDEAEQWYKVSVTLPNVPLNQIPISYNKSDFRKNVKILKKKRVAMKSNWKRFIRK